MVPMSAQTEVMRMIATKRRIQMSICPVRASLISSFGKTSFVMVALTAQTGQMKVLILILETVLRDVKPMVIMSALMEVAV